MGFRNPGEHGGEAPPGITIAQLWIGERGRRQYDEAGQGDQDLNRVGKRHRPHPADQRVDERDGRHDQDAGGERDAEVEIENPRQRRVLERDPGEVGRDLDAGSHEFGPRSILCPVEVGHRIELHPPERPGEEHAGQHERAGAGQRVEHHAQHALLTGRTRGGEHRGRPEPGSDQRAPGEEQRQPPACHDVISLALDLPVRIDADAQQKHHIAGERPTQEPDGPGIERECGQVALAKKRHHAN